VRPMLNTLYVTTEGAWLRKDGENVVMEVEGEERARLPIHMLAGLVCIGRSMVSPQLLGHCAERGVCVSFLSTNGQFLARVEGPVSGNVLLRRAQYRVADDSRSCGLLVRHLLVGKVNNQRAVLGRGLRDYADRLDPLDLPRLQQAHHRLGRIVDSLMTEANVDQLRGLEGEAAAAYFGVFGLLVRNSDAVFKFSVRSRRPPLDAMNALISLLYTLLTHDCRSALESVGLDPAVGFLHRDRPGRPSLALDLMEEFRPVLSDRLALSLINRGQVSKQDFLFMENGAVLLRDDARKVVLTAYQERKREELQHAFLGEKAPLGMFPFIQAQLMARHLRGDLDAYPPFLWR
jgi:CRISPR-associated protein Cas1